MKLNILTTLLITGTWCLCGSVGPAGAAEATAVGKTGNKPAQGQLQKGPREIIQEKIHAEVATRLKAAGASFDNLTVAVAEQRDSATPFKVSYSGLRDFKGADGSAPPADGEFVMKYIGGGQWQGALAGTQFTAAIGTRDNIDLPFVDDPAVLGEWQSIDFVADLAEFNPDKLSDWKDRLYLKGLTFLADGKTSKPWWTWTKGVLMHSGDKTASHYEIRELKGTAYLFLEWKSGDVTIAGMKPHYYVLKRK